MKQTWQKLTGEQIGQRTSNTLDEARLYIAARGFWATYQIVFFDIRAFYSNPTRHVNQTLQQCYSLNENEKRRKCNYRVMSM